MSDESSNFGNRFSRYVKVSGTATNLVSKFVVNNFWTKIDKEKHVNELFNALGNLTISNEDRTNSFYCSWSTSKGIC